MEIRRGERQNEQCELALLLRQQTEDYKKHATEKFELIKRRIEYFFGLTREMKRLLSGLVAVRVMGKVESVKMSGGNFPDLIDDLEQAEVSAAALAFVVHRHVNRPPTEEGT